MNKWHNNAYVDGVWYGEPFDTKEEATEYGISQYKKHRDKERTELFGDFDSDYDIDVFYIGKSRGYIPEIDAYRVIEDQQMMAYDECGEVSNGWLDDVTNEEMKSLQKILSIAFKSWLELNHRFPSFYCIDDIEEVDIKERL